MISAMPNAGLAIELQPAERAQLEQWESAHGTPQQVALRCRIILRAVAGQQNVAIAAGLGVSRPTVQLWRKRVHEQDRKSTRLNSSHSQISYAVFCLKKKK